MNWKEIVTDYFTFTRRERIGIILTLLVIIILAFSPSFFPSNDANKLDLPDTSWISALKKLEHKEKNHDPGSKDDGENYAFQYDPAGTNNNKPAGELFHFDPNTLSKEGWLKLGIRDRTIKTIENYLSKGGKFRKPEDLQRVYGLRKNEFERLVPFIRIQEGSKENIGKIPAVQNSSAEGHVPVKSYRSLPVEINSADTSALIALPGIGSKLATRIVNFREKLGGFYSIDQVGETFGLPDSTFQKIKEHLTLKPNTIKKININTATTEELKSHPYIRWSIANTVIAYRNEHGAFSNAEDIKKIMTITDDVYKKMAPYLVIQ
jgi:competence protein ComEA